MSHPVEEREKKKKGFGETPKFETGGNGCGRIGRKEKTKGQGTKQLNLRKKSQDRTCEKTDT